MQYEQDQEAKKLAMKIATEKDRRQAKLMVRYLLFYLAYIFVLSVVTYLFDLLFFSMYSGSIFNYPGNFLSYTILYMIMGFYIFPLSLVYNYIINHYVPNMAARIILAVLFTVIMGFYIRGTFNWGIYLGPYRELKNILALVCSGILIEVFRVWVVRYRLMKHQGAIEIGGG
jgi:hypothetical protein